MSEYHRIRLQLGEATGREFQQFWNSETLGRTTSKSLAAEFRPEQKANRGLALALPAEVVLVGQHIADFLQSDLGQNVMKGFAGSLGTAVAKFVWDKLKQFFSANPPRPFTSVVVVVVGSQQIAFNPLKMDDEPPLALAEAFRGIEGEPSGRIGKKP